MLTLSRRLKKRFRQPLLTFVAGLCLAIRVATAQAPPALVLVDTSGSMQGERIAAVVEAGKLFVFLSDGRLMIGHFADEAAASAPFELPQDWPAAAENLELLISKVGGGTRYESGLRLSAGSRFVIFLSDGEPSDLAEALEFVRNKVQVPIHAIALQAPDGAFQALSKMAAASRGAAHNVKNAEQLVDAFLSIHEQTRKSRRAEGRGSVRVPKATGEVIAIGFGAAPQFDSPVQPLRHVAKLSQESIHVARLDVKQQQDLLVTLPGSPQNRLIVLRYDLPRASSKVEPAVTATGGSVLSRTRFQDAAGAILDPHQKSGLSVGFTLLDPAGREVATVAGQLVPDQPEFAGRLAIPRNALGQSGWHLRTQTVDESSGEKFVETHVRALALDQPGPQTVAPPIDDLLRLRVLAHRKSGLIALSDSRVKSSRVALVGDRVSLELSPGTGLSEDEFRTVGLTLVAEFIGNDGAVRIVPLSYQDGAYRTAPVELAFPGRLQIRVRLEIQGAPLALDETVEIRDVVWQLTLHDPTRGLLQVPQYAQVPYTLQLAALVDGRPVSQAEMAEVIERSGVALQGQRSDSGGNQLQSVAFARQALLARPEAISATIWFLEQGEQTVRFTLKDNKDVALAGVSLAAQVVPAPLQARLQGNGPVGEPWWWSWLPSCCFRTHVPNLSAVPSPSPLSTLFFVAAADVDGQPVDWKTETANVLAPGDHEMRVRLERYRVATSPLGPAEFMLAIPVRSVPWRTWNNDLWWYLLLVPALVWGFCALPRLTWDVCRIDLLASGSSAALTTCWTAGIWPLTRLLVYRAADTSLCVATPGNLPPTAEAIACIDRTGRRRLRMKVLADVSGLNRGETIDLSYPNGQASLDGDTVLAMFGAEAQS